MIGYLLLLLIGLVSAAFGSLVGLGGGIIIVPALIFLDPVWLHLGITTPVAVGTSLLVLIITALSSTLAFIKQKRVDFRSGWLFFTTSGPASMLGAYLTSVFHPKQFQLWFGCFMLLMAILMIARQYMKPLEIRWKIRKTFTDAAGAVFEYGYSLIAALAIGFCVGFVSGLFGIGGGSLFVPMMVLLFAFPPHVATATSMFVIFLSSITGSAAHVLEGEISWLSALFLAPGAWIGGKIGARIASRMSGSRLLWLLRLTLFVLALRLIWEGLA
jgi:hypothetical protein